MATRRWSLALAGAATVVIVVIATVVLKSGEAPESAPEPPGYELTASATGGGSVSLEGASRHEPSEAVTLTAGWNDTTHTFEGWKGDCSGAEPTCAVTMDADKTVQANYEPRCPTPEDAGCIAAVYEGAAGDYATVAEIPSDVLIEPDAEGRYHVWQGRQITVVTSAALPAYASRFELRARALQPARQPPRLQAVGQRGAAYSFTVTADFEGAQQFALELVALAPWLPLPLQSGPAETMVSATFSIARSIFRYTRLATDGAPQQPGSYAILKRPGDASSAIGNFNPYTSSGAELRVHPSDADGISRARFYDGVQVGDRFDYRTNGLNCGFRFQVTKMSQQSGLTIFGIELIRSYGGQCDWSVDDPAAPQGRALRLGRQSRPARTGGRAGSGPKRTDRSGHLLHRRRLSLHNRRASRDAGDPRRHPSPGT